MSTIGTAQSSHRSQEDAARVDRDRVARGLAAALRGLLAERDRLAAGVRVVRDRLADAAAGARRSAGGISSVTTALVSVGMSFSR
jgi:hypothetical protein